MGASAAFTAFALLIEAIFPFAQFLAGAFFDIDATDGGQSQDFSLGVGNAQIHRQSIGREALRIGTGLLCEFDRLSLGNIRAHPLGRFHERPNGLCSFGVVPLPSQQPAVKVVGLGCLDMQGMPRDFSPPLGFEVEAAMLAALAFPQP